MESGMKVWELIAWLESHANPDDDVVLMDLPDPDNPPESCPFLHPANLMYEEEDGAVLIVFFDEEPI